MKINIFFKCYLFDAISLLFLIWTKYLLSFILSLSVYFKENILTTYSRLSRLGIYDVPWIHYVQMNFVNKQLNHTDVIIATKFRIKRILSSLFLCKILSNVFIFIDLIYKEKDQKNKMDGEMD